MSALVSFAGWSFVPNLASGFIHDGLLRAFPESLSPRGTTRYARDRRIIYAVVVLSYLIYTLVSAYLAIEPNYYDLLNVPLDVEEKQLRKAFRKISAVHHPDKGGNEEIFRSLRTAYDTLSNPTTRFGYDRFGPQVNAWDKLTLLSDYMYRGLISHVPFYLGSSFFLFVLGYIQNSHAMYWRVLTFLTLACFSFSIVTHAEGPWLLRYLCPRMVQYQQISLLQSICVTLLIAIAQVGPVLFVSVQDATSPEAMLETAAYAKMCCAEASQALQVNHLPFQRGTSKTSDLYAKTAEWMVQARIDQDPEVVDARQRLVNARQPATTT